MSSFYLRIILIIVLLIQSKAIAADDEGLRINIEEINGSNDIKFYSPGGVNAGVFLRGTKLWFVVDKNIEQSRLEGRTTSVIRNFSVFEKKGKYTIGFFEINNPNDYEITSSRNNDELIVKISSYDNSVLSSELYSDRHIIKNINFEGNFLDIQLNSSKGDIISFTDPDIGDQLFVIPEMISARTEAKSFIDFMIFESVSGVVIRKLNDSLKVSVRNNMIDISSLSYLNISSDENSETGGFASSILKLDLNSKTILDLSLYANLPQDFNYSLSKINSHIYNAYDSSVKAEGFLNLSLFLLNNQWYQESKSTIEIINRYSNIIATSYRVKMIIGAIYFMADAFAESSDILNSIDISNVPLKDRSEIRFWQRVSALSENNLINNREILTYNLKKLIQKLFERKSNFLGLYNEDIIIRLCLKIANVALEIDRFDIVQSAVNILSKSKLNLKAKQQLKYLQGHIYVSSNNYKKSLEIFRSCIENSADMHYYAKCKFHYLNTLYKTSQIDKTVYINNLQGLSTIWRGDDLEIKVLDTLANLYEEIGEVADAIRTWKIIANINSGSYQALISTTKGSKAFIKYFNESSDTKLEKLAFFYEFKDLIPLGDEGDTIILQTASYMLDLDLIDQAVKIIEYQIKNRLIGISKENIINDLVRTYNSIGKYDLGEKTVELFSSFPLNVTNPVIQERKYLYVESLIGTGQMQDAIALLHNEKSPKADELRAKAFFKLQDWDAFSYNSEPYIYSIRYSNKHLSDSDYVKILKQNISYFNMNQINLLNDLYLDMKPRFKKNQKNAERNKIFYNIANELQDGSNMTTSKKNKVQNLIKQLINS